MKDYPVYPLRIAIAQLTPEEGNIEGNVLKAISMIEEAAKQKADLIVFPEKFLTGLCSRIDPNGCQHLHDTT